MPGRPGNTRLADAAWLRRRYLDDGATIVEIAAEAGAAENTVHVALARHEIPTRYAHQIDRTDVERRLRKGQGAPEIAAAYGVNPAVIYDRLYRWGLATVSGAEEYDHDQLRQWYEVRGWSIQRIADQIGLSKRAATRVLLAAGITLRPPGRRSP